MSENKNPNEPKLLNDDDLSQVAGGRGNNDFAIWDDYAERELQADYAAHGNGMSLDDFIASKGYAALELECRNKWIRYGSDPSTSCVGNARGVDAVRV